MFFILCSYILGVKKRGFNADRWPVFKWSFDDKYFARMSEGALSIYETSTFRLLDNKSIKVAGMRDFTWSPSENILAYWVAEDKDVPARVTLLEIPSRNEVRVKNLFNVADCKMHWQKTGDYLCVKVSFEKKNAYFTDRTKKYGPHSVEITEIFLSLRFYVKPKLVILEVQKLPFWL